MSGIIKNEGIPVARRPARQSPITKHPLWKKMLEWFVANKKFGKLPVMEAFQWEARDLNGIFAGQKPLIAAKTAIQNVLYREFPEFDAAVILREKENPPSLYVEDRDTAVELGHTPERKKRKRDRR